MSAAGTMAGGGLLQVSDPAAGAPGLAAPGSLAMAPGRLLEALAPFSGVLLLIACLGLLLAVFFEQAQILAKYRGARRGVVATGYNNAMKLLVANRFGAVLYLFFVALAIDLGLDSGRLAAALALTVLLAGCSNLALLAGLRREERGPRPKGGGQGLAALLRAGGGRQRAALVGAFVATWFSFIGLSVPLIWSAGNPQLRLTLANSGFVFNSLFTLINVFLVESELARQIDRRSADIRPLVEALYLMRFAAGLAAAPVVWWLA